MVDGDLNGYVVRSADGYEGVHGGFGYGDRILVLSDATKIHSLRREIADY